MSAPAGPTSAGFRHELAFYTDAASLLAVTVPFVREGLAAGDPVLVAAPGPRLALIRAALGAAGDGVGWADMTDEGRNPGRIIPCLLQAFADRHPDRPVRIIGEPVWAGRTADEYRACAQHEAAINWAFAGRAGRILCPYDAGRLDPGVLAEARCTHPLLVGPGGSRRIAGYAPAAVTERHNKPLSSPAEPVALLGYDLATLPQVRRFVADHARAAGLAADRVADLQIAVTELATNSVAHAGGSGTLQAWRTDRHLVCEIHDDGWLADPLAGRLVPAQDGIGGRGLVIVHALCDLVLLHTTAAGTTIRLHMLREAP
ncbi:anti-sigma factor RsbA family regulatory protein [Micromonospora chaiyaphumensis]|uniref:Anti-sigma regulatory factor (Ser/Thr protein kinase) n=1 Tax=Micromonospora chaiyaphumensis TaxID=307119 RepID=A0A1C4U263_9ACTN|nr:sensor histidine kinase [Micromonospora chaiyaphumensis]SCE65734.1 Anti-sigma regulatory factor (Ser/Thr protein kinase) [Micromonospora chaiyaphumensis]